MNNRNILFNRGIILAIFQGKRGIQGKKETFFSPLLLAFSPSPTIFAIFAILAMSTLSASVACARMIEPGTEAPSDYHENAIRRFEVVSLISLPFTAIHSYLIYRGVKMIRTREFSPEISDTDYKIIGCMTITFSAFIGFWDWYHTRGKDSSQPKIPTEKTRKEQQGEYGANLNLKFDSISANKHSLSDDVILVHLYQIKF